MAPETIRIAWPFDLLEGVDGRVGPDERGVQAAVEERLDRLRPGIEGLGFERDVRAERLGEEAFGHADHGGRVGHVGEIAQPKCHRCRRW